MYFNQTVIIDYGNGQHVTYPNQTVKLFEYADVVYGQWNDQLVAAFYNNATPGNLEWHAEYSPGTIGQECGL